ncbi:hypothetical protein SCHPADRAFT_797815, partial [Schizopora paradoxa]
RPEQIFAWLKRARKLDIIPHIKSLTAYRDQWRAWYSVLMPAWRRANTNTWPLVREDHPNETWSTLMVSGPHGVQIIFMSLYWWS